MNFILKFPFFQKKKIKNNLFQYKLQQHKKIYMQIISGASKTQKRKKKCH